MASTGLVRCRTAGQLLLLNDTKDTETVRETRTSRTGISFLRRLTMRNGYKIWCLPRPLYAHPSVMAIDVCARGIPAPLRLAHPLTFAYSLGARELRNAAVSQTSHAL